MQRLIAYLLFSLGIAAAIIGGAKLPIRQIEFLSEQTQLKGQIAELDAELAAEKQQDLEADQLAPRLQSRTALQQTLQDLDGWPPKSTSERFSDAIPLFWVGVGMATFGLVLWRADMHKQRLAVGGALHQTSGADGEHAGETPASTVAEGGTSAPATDLVEAADNVDIGAATRYIKSIQPAMLMLTTQMSQETLPELPAAIDVVLEAHVKPFVELRGRLIEAMGLAEAAPILLTMAQGERLLNRAWSAAADGYQQESTDSITEASLVFRDALNQLDGAAADV